MHTVCTHVEHTWSCQHSNGPSCHAASDTRCLGDPPRWHLPPFQLTPQSLRERCTCDIRYLPAPSFAFLLPQLPPGQAQQSEVLQQLIDSEVVNAVEGDVTMQAVQAGMQNGAPWGLDRIDQVNLPLSGTYSYTRGAGDVVAFVLDTGG